MNECLDELMMKAFVDSFTESALGVLIVGLKLKYTLKVEEKLIRRDLEPSAP